MSEETPVTGGPLTSADTIAAAYAEFEKAASPGEQIPPSDWKPTEAAPPEPPAAPAEQPADGAAAVEATPPDPKTAAWEAQEQARLQRYAQDKVERDQRATAEAETARQLQEYKLAKARVKADPIGYFNALGFDPQTSSDIATQILLEKAGEAAPKELKEQRHLVETRSEVAKLEARIAQLEAEKMHQQEAAQIGAWVDDTSQSVASLPASKYPWTHNLISASPNEFRQALQEVAQAIATQKGYVPAPQEVAQAIEEREARLARRYGGATAPTTRPQQPPSRPATTAKPLTNQLHTSTPPSAKLPLAPRDRLEILLQQMDAGTFDPDATD